MSQYEKSINLQPAALMANKTECSRKANMLFDDNDYHAPPSPATHTISMQVGKTAREVLHCAETKCSTLSNSVAQ